MSALAWLFGLGFLALAGPLLFHLIRRTPKGEVPFSSLMFLRPTPPRLTRRSRLDNLLLLFLRMAAVALIAAAFMRPFFNSNVRLDFGDMPGRKTAVLLDTSASMKRADLWEQARQKLGEVIDKADANDEIAVFTFDKGLSKQIDFAKKSEASSLLEKSDALKSGPNWNSAKLGDALVDIANRLLDSDETGQGIESEEGNNQSIARKLQVVVISDMQSGSSTTALQSFRWPEQIKVQFSPVATKTETNATLELLPVDEGDPEQVQENVLVRNSKESASDQFSVSWEGSSVPAIPFQVPAGSSKILRVSRDSSAQSSSTLLLTGDDADFDNQYFAVAPARQTISIRYVGDESPNDPEGMLYYFKRSLVESPNTTFDLKQLSNEDESITLDLGVASPDFLVVTRSVTEIERDAINEQLNRGTTLLVVLGDQSVVDSTRAWTCITDVDDSGRVGGKYAMLGNIEFAHPVFAPFSGPRFNDFTQVRFWEVLKPTLSDNVQVIARFDDDSPAVWHQLSHDKSDIYVFGFGWQPTKSQLALSSKFLPLMMRMIELATKTEPIASSSVVGQSIKIPKEYDQFVLPDGAVENVEDIKTVSPDFPGIHSFKSSSDSALAELQVAVNIDPAESQTDPMPVEQLSALGVSLGMHNTTEEEFERQRQLLDFELENRQKLWKWLVLGAIGLIICESFIAGRTDRTNRNQESSEQGIANE